MKKNILLLISFAACIITGCGNDDDDTSQQSTALNGKWKLESAVLSPMSGGTYTYSDQITWTFNEADKKVTVNATADDNNPLDSGIYDYTNPALENVCTNSLMVGQQEFGCITITNNKLQLSMGHVDGSIYNFVKQ
jgi:hypothetical protein